MKQPSPVWICVLLLCAILPGLSECIENVVHLAENGHSAHSEPAGDAHAPPGPEHGCTGTFHLCSCCSSPGFELFQSRAQVPELVVVLLDARTRSVAFSTETAGIDHPPRV